MKRIRFCFSGRIGRALFVLFTASFFFLEAWGASMPPRLLAPSNGATLSSWAVALRWESSEGAKFYEVEVGSPDGEILFSHKTDAFFVHLSPEAPRQDDPYPRGRLKGNHRYYWRVRSCSGTRPGPWSASWAFLTPPECLPEIDGDCDGIPDAIELAVFKTDPGRKTLFVRPCRKMDAKNCQMGLPGFYFNEDLGTCFSYWDVFYHRIFPESKDGRAAIPAFEDAGIEVVVLGAKDNPCEAFKGEAGFGYCPSKNPDWPCDVLEIIADTSGPPEGYGGHTYFAGNRWTWSPMGHSSGIGYEGEYGVAVVYLYSVDRYFDEGAYRKIAEKEAPLILDCRKAPDQCRGASPNNLDDQEKYPASFSLSSPDPTVEFNDILFDVDGVIRKIKKRGKPYTKNQVIARILVHEMGHALLGLRHCQNPCCALNEETKDWEERLFGPWCAEAEKKPRTCLHDRGATRDIREPGIVHNRRHPQGIVPEGKAAAGCKS